MNAKTVCLLIAGAFFYCCGTSGAQDGQATAALISKLPVFDFPILAVSPEPGDGDEEMYKLLRDKSVPPTVLFEEIENFLVRYPDSSLGASLHSHLGIQNRRAGRYSAALRHWEIAWQKVRRGGSPEAIAVGDLTLAHWSQLLASLGRVDRLRELFTETIDRPVNEGTLGQMFLTSREAYPTMIHNPGVAFRCGIIALGNMALELKGSAFDPTLIRDRPSPATGFSIQELVDLSAELGIEAVAVRRTDKQIVVPSIIHWKEDHFAAIVRKEKNLYLVIDPTFGHPVWLEADVIDDECSGYFVISKELAPEGWQKLTFSEASSLRGRGYPNVMPPDAPPCVPAPEYGICCVSGGGGGGGGGGNGGGTGGGTSGGSPGGSPGTPGGPSGSAPPGSPGGTPPVGPSGASPGEFGSSDDSSGCDGCGEDSKPRGMAKWAVTEPFLSLQLHDIPLWYQPSVGRPVEFGLYYNQRDYNSVPANVFGTGERWRPTWLSWIDLDTNGNTMLHASGGGTRFYNGTNVEYQSSTRLDYLGSGLGDQYRVTYADGSEDYYAFRNTNSAGLKRFFLTERKDRHDVGIQLNYIPYSATNTGVKLSTIEDIDGKLTSIGYDPTNAFKIASISNPHGKTATLLYNVTGARITAITDMGGLTTSFTYGNGRNLWISEMVTPYGTNSFDYTDLSMSSSMTSDPANTVNRSVRVTTPSGGKHLYIYRDLSTHFYEGGPEFLPLHYSGDDLPQQFIYSNDPYNYYASRNSWYWGPRQFASLPAGFQSSFDFNVLTNTANYAIARMRHWPHGDPIGTNLTVHNSIAFEREPSPDATGLIPGQITWYEYDRGSATLSDTIQMNAISRIMPDGHHQIIDLKRDRWGRTTNIAERYSTGVGTNIDTRERSFIFDDNFNLIAELDPTGAMVYSNVFNATRRLATNYNAFSEPTVFFWDSVKPHLLTGVSYPSGLAITNSYFTSGPYSGWREKVVIQGISTNSFTYLDGLLRTHTDFRNTTRTYTWDNLNRVNRIDFPDLSFVQGIFQKLDLVQIVDRGGNTNQFQYNSIRKLVNHTNELGRVTHLERCDCGALESITDALTNTTYFTYNNKGRLVHTLFPDNSWTTNALDSLSRITNVTHSSGGSEGRLFNMQGILVEARNGAGLLAGIGYDIEDRMVSRTNAAGVQETSQYDALDRLRTNIVVGVATNIYGYTTRGLTNATDAFGKLTVFNRDVLGRPTHITNPNTEITQLIFHGPAELHQLIDGKSQSTTWHYDSYGRSIKKLDHTGATIQTNGFNPRGEITNRWTPQKGLMTFSYDRAGNLRTNTSAMDVKVYTYDALNRLQSASSASFGVTTFAYNSSGQISSEDGPWDADTVTYGYSHTQRSALTLSQPHASAWHQSYFYDAQSRLTNIVSPSGSFDYVYFPNASRLLDRVNLPNGAYIDNSYSHARLTGTTLFDSANQPLNVHDYGYAAFRRNKQTFKDGNFIDYTYDNAGQLASAIGKESGGGIERAHERFGYKYDAAGNLNTRTNHLLVQTFVPNALNQLSNVTRTGNITVAGFTTTSATVSVNGSTNSVTTYQDLTFARTNMTLSAGSNTFTAVATDATGRSATNVLMVNLPATVSCQYDLNGNLVSDGLRGFDYDDENQLTRITVTNNWKSEFVYDALRRRRVSKEFIWKNSGWVTGSETRHIYDGMLPIQERDGQNVVRVTYTRGLDLSGTFQNAGGIGGLLARADHSSLTPSHSFYHSDGSGNVTMLVNQKQVTVAKYLYDSFGNTLAKSGPLAEANTYRFSSKEYHPSSGLLYYGYRFYDANLQRWLNKDPIGVAGGINLYRFNLNSPTFYVDSFGLSALVGVLPLAGGFAIVDGPLPVGDVIAGGLLVGAVLWDAFFDDDDPLPRYEPKPKGISKPSNCPPGTKPIDESKYKDRVHPIKDAIGAAANDWTGVTPDDHVITGDSDGNVIDHGPAENLAPNADK